MANLVAGEHYTSPEFVRGGDSGHGRGHGGHGWEARAVPRRLELARVQGGGRSDDGEVLGGHRGPAMSGSRSGRPFDTRLGALACCESVDQHRLGGGLGG